MNESNQQQKASLLRRVGPGSMRAVRAVAFGLLIVVGWAVVVTHGGDFYDSLTKPPPGHDIVMPEDALPDDDAFATVEKLAAPIHKAVKDRDCLGKPEASPTIDWSCVDTVVREAADPLRAVDDWLAGPSRYKLDRPENLGHRLRIQGQSFSVSAPIPNFLAFRNLAKALAYRGVSRWRAGDVAGAERDFRVLFALGAFLQQNPLLIGHMVGIAVHNTGVDVLTKHMPLEALPAGAETMLAEPDDQLDGLRVAIGSEWRMAQELVRHDLEQNWDANEMWGGAVPLPFLKSLGFFSPAHTLRLIAEDQERALSRIQVGALATPPAGSDAIHVSGDDCLWRPPGWPLTWMRNPVGRMMVCIRAPLWSVYIARTGQMLDKVEATKVMLAARRFKREHRHWPSQEADLVPVYVKAWPTSTLDGQPLRWLDDKTGVVVMGPDGKSLCEPSKLCRFPFAPPAPVVKASKGAH